MFKKRVNIALESNNNQAILHWFQASEIVESIRWVGVDWPEVMEEVGSLLKTYDRKDWTCMNRIVDTFNKVGLYLGIFVVVNVSGVLTLVSLTCPSWFYLASTS